MIVEIYAAIITVILGGACYAIWNVNRKNNYYEAWILAYQKALTAVLENMKSIDHSGAFASDDEVGQVFNLLKSQLFVLEEFITKGAIK